MESHSRRYVERVSVAESGDDSERANVAREQLICSQVRHGVCCNTRDRQQYALANFERFHVLSTALVRVLLLLVDSPGDGVAHVADDRLPLQHEVRDAADPSAAGSSLGLSSPLGKPSQSLDLAARGMTSPAANPMDRLTLRYQSDLKYQSDLIYQSDLKDESAR
jgi:hypothetical protein